MSRNFYWRIPHTSPNVHLILFCDACCWWICHVFFYSSYFTENKTEAKVVNQQGGFSRFSEDEKHTLNNFNFACCPGGIKCSYLGSVNAKVMKKNLLYHNYKGSESVSLWRMMPVLYIVKFMSRIVPNDVSIWDKFPFGLKLDVLSAELWDGRNLLCFACAL